MPLNDGQTLAAIVAASGAATAILGYFQNRFGKRIDREGTRDTRQTAIEENLRAQSSDCNKRIDALTAAAAASEERFRAQLEDGARERRLIENEFRAEIHRIEVESRTAIHDLETEVDALKLDNEALRHENFLLRNPPIGSAEPRLPPPTITLSPDGKRKDERL